MKIVNSKMKGCVAMSVHSCSKVLVVVLAIVSFICVAANSEVSLSETDLKCCFKSIVFDGTNYMFSAKRKCFYKISALDNNEGEYRMCEGGASITLNDNSELTISEHHFSLTITPTPFNGNRKGLLVARRNDLRSFGGDVSTNYAYLVVADEKSDSSDERKSSSDTNAVARTKARVSAKATAPEKKFLKGLKLLPCD